MAVILENKMIVPNMYQMVVEAPDVAAAVAPGQFAIVRPDEDGERIPLTLCDWDTQAGTVTLMYLVVGRTTRKLASLKAGEQLATMVGPLGNPMPLGTFGHVLCIGGCYGIASLYPVAKALQGLGNRVTILTEARSSFLLYWHDRLKTASDQLISVTRDGTQGLRGHMNVLPKVLSRLSQPVDRVIVNGCNYLMMRACQETQPLQIKTIVSLNTLMIDGTGMCGVCRVMVAGATKFACVDGPHFDGHEVNWDELTNRRKAYLREETDTLRSSAGSSVG